MAKEIEEYKQKMEKLEEEVAHYKVNMNNVSEFWARAFEIQDEISTIQRLMYVNLYEFHNHVTQSLTYLKKVKDKKVVLYGIQLSMDELKKCQAEEKGLQEDLPRVTEWECRCNYASLENYQATSRSLEKDIIGSINNYKHLLVVVEKVLEICHIPPIEDMGSPRIIIDVPNKLEESMRGKRITIVMTLRISKRS